MPRCSVPSFLRSDSDAMRSTLARHEAPDFALYLAGGPVIETVFTEVLMSDVQRVMTLALLVNAVILFAGTTAAVWLLFRATRVGTAPATFVASAWALFVTALLLLNVQVLTSLPIASLGVWLQPPADPPGMAVETQRLMRAVWSVARLSTPLIGVLLLLVPALVVTRGLGFLAAVRTLLGLAVRRPAVLVAAHLGLAVLALLPLGSAVAGALVSSGVIRSGFTPAVFPDSVLLAFSSALQRGLLIYLTALVANALVESSESP